MRHSILFLFPVLFAVAGLLGSCASEDQRRLEAALEFAGSNRGELERVLAHYRHDPEKREAAGFLIRNMPRWYAYEGWQLDTLQRVTADLLRTDSLTDADSRAWQRFDYHSLKKVYDAQVISADYLIDNIDQAFEAWKGRPWNRTLPFDDFCELILPYRVGDERLTNWRKLYRDYYGALLDSLYPGGTDVLEACCVVNAELARQDYRFSTDLKLPHHDATFLFNHRIGYCREADDLALYAMRACGIPVAAEFMPFSPDYRHSHEWTVMRDTTGQFILFSVDKIQPSRQEGHGDTRKKGKAYRYCYGLQPERLEHARQTGSLLGGEEACYWKDATACHFGHNRVSSPLFSGVNGPVFLSVFAVEGWKPIDTGRRQGDHVVFEDVEPDVIYMPVYRGADRSLQPAGFPFIPRADGSMEVLQADTAHTTTVTLGRKMPVLPRLKHWEYCQVGARLEGDDSPDFRHPQLVCSLTDTVRYTYHEQPTQAGGPFRYVRYHSPRGTFIRLMELQLFADTAGREQIPLSAVDSLFPYQDMRNITDGDVLTGFRSVRDTSCYLTFRLKSLKPVRMVRYTPHTDDNYVWAGDEYELLYQDGTAGWKSLGRRQATGKTVSFEAPAGALLWLRDLTKGNEEQVFVWRDGRQWFTSDL
jgi:hypothetical protein